MALTKVGKEGITGISNSSDATAITIDSNENVGIGGSETSVFNGVGGDMKFVVIGDDSTTTVANNSDAGIAIVNTNQTAGNLAGLHFARADTDDSPNYAGASIVARFPDAQVTGQYPKGELVFLTSTAANSAPSEKMRLLSSGGITFNGDTAAANALSDYEFGTFDPDLTCSGTNYSSRTIGSRGGYYEKVGNAVFTYIYLDLSAFTLGSGSGNMKISGLPFSASTARAGSGGGGGVAFHGVNVGSTVYNVMPYASGSEVIFLTSRDQASWTAVQIGDIHSGTIFGVWFQLNYYVD